MSWDVDLAAFRSTYKGRKHRASHHTVGTDSARTPGSRNRDERTSQPTRAEYKGNRCPAGLALCPDGGREPNRSRCFRDETRIARCWARADRPKLIRINGVVNAARQLQPSADHPSDRDVVDPPQREAGQATSVCVTAVRQVWRGSAGARDDASSALEPHCRAVDFSSARSTYLQKGKTEGRRHG